MRNHESELNRDALRAVERERQELLERVNAEGTTLGHPTAREVPWVEQQDLEPDPNKRATMLAVERARAARETGRYGRPKLSIRA